MACAPEEVVSKTISSKSFSVTARLVAQACSRLKIPNFISMPELDGTFSLPHGQHIIV